MTGPLTHFSKLPVLFVALTFLVRPASEPEDELKAAVVLSFLRYTDWTPVPAQEPITVGVVGRSGFSQVLRKTLEGKTAGTHPLAVMDTQDGSCGKCQVLYVAGDRSADVRRALSAVGSPHMLTIGEADHFLEWGGAISLFSLDGHMSFEVNLDAVARTGVTISSKLLRFGQIRGGKREREP